MRLLRPEPVKPVVRRARPGDYRVVPFEAWHVGAMRPAMAAQADLAGADGQALARVCEAAGAGFSLIGPAGGFLAASGVHLLWPGVAEGWAFIAEQASRHGLAVARAVTEGLDGLMLEHALHRVQAHVHAGSPDARRLVEWLGFTLEGVARKYGSDGSDYLIFARVE